MKKILFISLLVVMCNLATANYSESMTFNKSKNELYSLSRLFILEKFDCVTSYKESGDSMEFETLVSDKQVTVKITCKEGLLMITFMSENLNNVTTAFELADYISNFK